MSPLAGLKDSLDVLFTGVLGERASHPPLGESHPLVLARLDAALLGEHCFPLLGCRLVLAHGEGGSLGVGVEGGAAFFVGGDVEEGVFLSIPNNFRSFSCVE